MRVEYLASYDRAFRKLPPLVQSHAIEAIDSLLDYFQTGRRPHGLGLKRLRKVYWEIRVGLDVRILFQLQRDYLSFVFVGDHDEMRRWLREL